MATQPTNLPVPSESPFDFKFNAGKIDEFVTSMGWTYTDRFGQKHYTIEGINYLAQQAMNAFGYVILTGKTFTTGATINNPNEVLLNTADGEYYKWTGSFASGPKVVPENSTPASTGGIAPGAWIGVGDASLRAALAALSGAGLVGFNGSQSYPANTVGAELKLQSEDIASLENKLPYAVKTLASVLKKANDGTAITIACYGDSLTYGQDTSATGTGSPINGATQSRSPNPYPEALATSLTTIGFSASVINRGYPGDTSSDGLTRWASASATDVAIIMYGTNDAMNYGGTGLVSVDDFRKNISSMIERERAKGAVVILMSPPNVAERIANAKIAPYRAQIKYLADAYSLTYIDASQQIETMTKLWTDNVHLTSFAYNELGWHIASLFANREGSIQSVCAGQIFHPTDHIGYGGGTSFKVVAGSKGNNFLIELAAGQIYAIGVYCSEDVLPVIHSVNSQGTNTSISAYYSGAPSSTSGIKTAGLAHQSSLGYRQKLTAQKLSKGYRTLYLLNNGTVPAYIEAIEFQCLSQPAMTLGFFSKSDALSGIHQPARISNATNGWVAVDTSRMLTADCQFCARLTLGTEAIGGLALMNGFQNAPNNFTDNAILAIRSGAILGIREIVNGVVGADTPASGVFPATGTWTGEIEMEIVGTTCNVYVDGVLKVTKTGITVNRGYPAVYGQTSQRLTCHSALIKGYTKAIYE
ncbi:GDSL-type esterase/lipase family protein [Enterobacter kobei]|uniref:GDSL-type esterase/lipase family protein n=1 Tax=Enterobacter kobei TaxID=208224 RepID=UPI002A82B6BF|nr:GDSL-type esterase/lipase family protein [Enterobacter kobei]